MKDGGLKIVFAGGGTGGHLYPALAIAEELRRQQPSVDILVIGAQGKIESRVVPTMGYSFRTLWISGLARRFSTATLLFPLKLLVASVQAATALLQYKPVVVVGTGGYVCGPPLFIATLLGIPTLIQEQNSFPGATTRLLAGRVTEVHLSFERSRKFLRRQENVHITGNPTRAVIGTVSRDQGTRFFGIDPAKKTLLVFGGSQGATAINAALQHALPTLLERKVQVLWGTGERNYEAAQEVVRRLGSAAGEMVKVFGYFEKIEYAYAACDLVLARAGATTLAEITAAGVASVLVPYPYAAADHQTENAKAMEEGGAAVLCAESDLGSLLGDIMTDLLGNADKLKDMARRARSLGHPSAAHDLAQAVLRLAGN